MGKAIKVVAKIKGIVENFKFRKLGLESTKS